MDAHAVCVIAGKADHEGTRWVFIDGSEAGMPLEEVRVEQKGLKATPPPPILPLLESQGRIAPGERVRLSGDLSEGVAFRLLVSGDLSPKDVKKLIKLIKVQLEDEDTDGTQGEGTKAGP